MNVNMNDKPDEIHYKSKVEDSETDDSETGDNVSIDDGSIHGDLKDHVNSDSQSLDPEKHFYCLQIKYEQGSREDEAIINRAAKMAGEAMIEQTKCNHGIENMIVENTYSIATAIAAKDENFFAKALYCKYEKYPIGIMLGQYNPVLKIAISPVLYIDLKYRTDKLADKLQATFKYWAVNTKKADRVLVEKLIII